MFRELKFRRFQFLLIFIFSTSFIISGKTNGVFIENYKDLKLELITDELEIPWGMDFLDNGDIDVNETIGHHYLKSKHPDIYHKVVARPSYYNLKEVKKIKKFTNNL